MQQSGIGDTETQRWGRNGGLCEFVPLCLAGKVELGWDFKGWHGAAATVAAVGL